MTGLTRHGVLGMVPKNLIILQFLQKLCKAFVPSVLSRFFSKISISLKITKI